MRATLKMLTSHARTVIHTKIQNESIEKQGLTLYRAIDLLTKRDPIRKRRGKKHITALSLNQAPDIRNELIEALPTISESSTGTINTATRNIATHYTKEDWPTIINAVGLISHFNPKAASRAVKNLSYRVKDTDLILGILQEFKKQGTAVNLKATLRNIKNRNQHEAAPLFWNPLKKYTNEMFNKHVTIEKKLKSYIKEVGLRL